MLSLHFSVHALYLAPEFVWFYFMISICWTHFVCILFSWFNELFLFFFFSCSSFSFLRAILNSLSGKLQVSISEVGYWKITVLLCGFTFLKALCSCCHIWSSSHLLQSLLNDLFNMSNLRHFLLHVLEFLCWTPGIPQRLSSMGDCLNQFSCRGSWTTAERGYSQFTGHCRVQSWDWDLYSCYLTLTYPPGYLSVWWWQNPTKSLGYGAVSIMY